MPQNYNLTRAKRKTIVLSVSEDLSVQVKAPLRMPLAAIDLFVAKHEGWIARQSDIIERRRGNRLTTAQAAELTAQAHELLPERVAYYSGVMGVTPAGVKITSAQSRWGSCSGRNSLCFSYRIMLLPPALVDYIVVHELAHIRVRNHGAGFYNEVAAYLPDYKSRIAELKSMERELPRSP